MRWKIRQFIFCDQKLSLSTENSTIQLEPLLVDVLSFFCRHPDEMISRDKLIEEVWQSAVITDNAVNRVIAKLRKVFDDDPRAPEFIATFPKKGYKFIAPVTPLPDEQISPDIAAAQPLTIRWKLPFAIFLVFLVAFSWLQYNKQPSQPAEKPYKVTALTRGGDSEFSPAISPDGQYLVYSTRAEGRMRLFLKELASEKIEEIGAKDGWSGPASWSKDSQNLVFLNTTSESCQYYLLKLKGMESVEQQLIHNCPLGSAGKMIFSHTDRLMIYAEAKGRGFPYEIFSLDRVTQEKRRLPQPDLVLGGNVQFDLHPTKNNLLISSPDERQWLTFYDLDLEKEELDYLFKLEGWLCCAIWSQSGDRAVLMGEHPAYQLVSYDLQGKNRQVIYDTTHMVSSPERFPNGRDYLYVGGNQNRDIHYYDIQTKQSHNFIRSSVDDRIATFNHDATQLAYVSEKSGQEEIWLKSMKDEQDIKLTSLKHDHRYFDLEWSPDSQNLVAKSLNELHLISVKSGEFQKLKIPQTEIRAVSWKDNKTLAYSIKRINKNSTVKSEWRVNNYNINTHQASAEEGSWQYIHYGRQPENNLWVDQKGLLYWGGKKTLLNKKIEYFIWSRKFSPVKKGQYLYYMDWQEGKSALMQINLNDDSLTEQAVIDSVNDFSIGSESIVYSVNTNQTADIYRTVSR